MADIFYGMNRGDQKTAIVVDTSSPSKNVEIVVDDAVSLTKAEVIHCLQQMILYIHEQPDYAI